MDLKNTSPVVLENKIVSLAIDPFGGAIQYFRLRDTDINPLSFSFSDDQMPSNNKPGANFQGHFVCIGRWGLPSEEEIKAGMPNHGEPANISWKVSQRQQLKLEMEVVAEKEGLKVDRVVELEADNPVILVKETITNLRSLGRLSNIVQHPSLAAPFLDNQIIVDCNASKGFDQADYKNIGSHTVQWPFAKDNRNQEVNLRNTRSPYNVVYSFIVKPDEEFGWVTAYSPTHHQLIGYLWRRSDFPWIHLWQHFKEDEIQYMGIEFGTAGIHQPYKEILQTATTVFGENTFEYLEAGASKTKKYISFVHKTNEDFEGVKNVGFNKNQLMIQCNNENNTILINISQNLINELSE